MGAELPPHANDLRDSALVTETPSLKIGLRGLCQLVEDGPLLLVELRRPGRPS